MFKLTDTQLVTLSTAAQRDDGAVVLPDRLKGGAATKVMKPLLAKGLVKEVRAKPGMPVWRRNKDEAQSYALTVTRAGRKAINVESNDETGDPSGDATKIRRPAATASHARMRQPRRSRSNDGPNTIVSATKTPSVTVGPRAGSKLALVIGMLCKRGGATIDALVSATGWLPHTTRAALTGLRKRGYRLERERPEDGKTLYRIVAESNRDAA
jgi:Protein of unknown function (DUF3489)